MARAGPVACAFVLAAVGALAAGCASLRLTDWRGHTIGEVTEKFGIPSRVERFSGGWTVYVYLYEKYGAEPAWGPDGTVVPNSYSWTESRRFLVRPDGTVADFFLADPVEWAIEKMP